MAGTAVTYQVTIMEHSGPFGTEVHSTKEFDTFQEASDWRTQFERWRSPLDEDWYLIALPPVEIQ